MQVTEYDLSETRRRHVEQFDYLAKKEHLKQLEKINNSACADERMKGLELEVPGGTLI